MARYRPAETQWIRAACVAGGYLVAIAVLFILQIGDAVHVPVPLAIAAPPLVYAALSVIVLRDAAVLRRLSWIGEAFLVHLMLGLLAAVELMVAGGLGLGSGLAQVFVLFAPAPVLTLLATPLVLAPFSRLAAPRSAPAPEPRQGRAVSAAPASARPRSIVGAPLAPGRAAARPAAPVPPVAGPAARQPTPPAPAPPAVPVRSVGTSSSAAVLDTAAGREGGTPRSPASSPARTDEAMVRVSFERVAAQLPAEAFVLPFDRLAASLKEPNTLLVPRRIVLSEMREGAVAVDWATVSSQFPELALGISDAEFRSRYPALRLSLPVDEILSQLPADTLPLASAVLGVERPARTLSGAATATAVAPTVVTEPAERRTTLRPAAPAAAPVASAPAAAATSTPAQPPIAGLDREVVGRIVASFAGVGPFETVVDRVGDVMLVGLVAVGLRREAVSSWAAPVIRFAGAEAIVTVRTTRAAIVVAGGPTAVAVASPRPGVPVALLELRMARALATLGAGAQAAPTRPPRPLQRLTVDERVAGAGRALASLGAVQASVFAAGGGRVYAFCSAGDDAGELAALALDLRQSLSAAAGDLGRLVSVAIRRGERHHLVRLLGDGMEVLAASGVTRRPGRVRRDAERAATLLETL